MRTVRRFVSLASLTVALVGAAVAQQPTLSVPFEKFELDNGLDVVFHVDRSDPVVAVALAAHVGSARERPGRTGFAHLFEHLLFLESENLGKGGLDALSARVGGSGANGFTTRDQTNYFQTVPADALEKMLWAEADKLGYFINTVSEPVLAKEKEVVKNEKRQGVDNRPYGHTQYVIGRNLYPAGHPYSWQVIGSLDDLQAATLDDVKDFYRRYYVPNNVTLVVAGDFDTAQARAWVERYFGEIPAGEPVAAPEPQPADLAATQLRYHEDNFAKLPELTYAWPTVEEYHPDAYALQVLADYLADGRSAPLYRALVEQAELASRVSMFPYASEIAGELNLRVRAYEGVDLDRVAGVVDSTLASFRDSGIPAADLERIKAQRETAFYQELSSVLGKAFQLAQYNTFAGDPGYVREDIERLLAVSAEDVLRVYETYLGDEPYVATSFVPEGAAELALEGSTPAEVVEEEIVEGAEAAVDPSVQVEYVRTPSSFDRTVEPPAGKTPVVSAPDVWRDSLANGLAVLGIATDEVPLVDFDLRIDGGAVLDPDSLAGRANLLAGLLGRGTASRTPAELEAALQRLGAELDVYVTDEYLHLAGTTLARNYDSTMALVTEVLLSPRLDARELELLRRQAASRIQQNAAEPNAIAGERFAELLYGEGDPRARTVLGTETSVERVTLDDVEAYYRDYLSPTLATLHVVGDVDPAPATAALGELAEAWSARSVELPELPAPTPPDSARVYFVDVPDAKQSVIRVGYPALAATDERYYPAEAMNYILGGGGFASRLTQELREAKGYTYGIGSGFAGGRGVGPFSIGTGVRTNVTREAAEAIRDILAAYAKTYTADDLATTRSALVKGNARAFETAGAKLGMLREISAFGYPDDYVERRGASLANLTLEQVRALANELIDPDRMYWLIVGDAATQVHGIDELGYGRAILLESKG